MAFRKNRQSRQSLQNEQTEDFRIEIDIIFRDFCADASATEYTFPPNLSNLQRKYIHEKCRRLGLKSKSKGKNANRALTMQKNVKTGGKSFDLVLSNAGIDVIHSYVQRNCSGPVESFNNIHGTLQNDVVVGRLSFGKLVTPKSAKPTQEFEHFRQNLPVFEMRRHILDTIHSNQVTIISGETGSGKTTQIPQYLLEELCENNKDCRIICTQPRRISTVAVAERVAEERNEDIGATCGYQIKLESRTGPNTALVYCTTGILLRTLMGGSAILNYITHIIIDEIHERDKFTDFVLICLREYLKNFPSLRLILMSATLDVELFENYFEKVGKVGVQGRTFPIKQYFLEHILAELNYESESMRASRLKSEREEVPHEVRVPEPSVDQSLLREMDEALVNCMEDGSDDNFMQVLHLILSDSVPVDHLELTNGYTPLIVAAAKGNQAYVNQLLYLGADISLKSNDGRLAIDWANQNNHGEIAQLIADFEIMKKISQKDILGLYNQTTLEDMIDYDLILAIVTHIHKTFQDNMGILIFLPGYDDIIGLCEVISNCPLANDLKVCMLHGSMMINAQHEVFKRSLKRKVILSTNVAETSITIDDVAYVINCGRVKQKSYDSLSGTSCLETTWTSMASVNQRAGRAGRCTPGKCFHLLSTSRYESLLVNTIPEILTVPLHELCLQTKLLAPQGTKIADFLSKALEAPGTSSIEKAISGLVSLGALDAEENLTMLGSHLLRLSIDPHLGKMLLYSVVLKCLDPVLTIVATLAHKEPFVLPCKGFEKVDAGRKRKALSSDTLSDHMSLLMAFQKWQAAKLQNCEQRFCRENFISPGCMEMITVTRNHIVGQLRATGFIPIQKERMKEVTQYCESWPMVKAALAAGLYPNVAFSHNNKVISRNETRVMMHSSSCVKGTIENSSGLWFVYEEMSKLGKLCNLKCVTAVTPATIVLISGSFVEFDEESLNVRIDDSLCVNIRSESIWKFRLALDNYIQNRINKPQSRVNKTEENTLATLQTVLSAEDSHYNLTHPAGIGERPRFLHKKSTHYIPKKITGDSQCQDSNTNRNGYSESKFIHHGAQKDNKRGPPNNGLLSGRYVKRNVPSRPCPESSFQRQKEFLRDEDFDRYSVGGPSHQGFLNGGHSFDKQPYRGVPLSLSEPSFEGSSFGGPLHGGGSLFGSDLHKGNTYGSSHNGFLPGGPSAVRSASNEEFSNGGRSLEMALYNGSGNELSCHEEGGFVNDLVSSASSVSLNHDFHGKFDVAGNTLINAIAPRYVNIAPFAKFVVIRPREIKNIMISISQSTWNFSPQTERKIFRSYMEGFEVYLLFNVRGTNVFQAVAKLLNTNNGEPNSPSPIEWLGTRAVTYDKVLHLIIPKPSAVDDGFEVPYDAGLKITRLLTQDSGNHNKNSRPILDDQVSFNRNKRQKWKKRNYQSNRGRYFSNQ